MNMPKSREFQAKSPSPKAIFIGFLLVTMKVLSSYEKIRERRRQYMKQLKKRILTALLVVSAAALVGCGNNNTTATEKSTTRTTETETK